jgi:bis(5'-nucleosyl)-tetraphosphatase (symmetrical)
MATWAVGDVQGCATTLRRLIARIGFDDACDRLWLVGDLVNRGRRSAEVLRLVRALGERAMTVLGNHDLHLIARVDGVDGPKRRDTLDDVLGAPDRALLVDWLRARPFAHREGGYLLVHAGLLPAWTVDDAERVARAAEAALQTGGVAAARAVDGLDPLVELRMVDRAGQMLPRFTGAPGDAPADALPWFAHPARRSRSTTVVFGHWSALGLHLGRDAIGLDTGCVWGRSLTAVRLEDRTVVNEPAADEDRP